VAYVVNRADSYGIQTNGFHIDMKKIRQRKRDIVESFRSGSERRVNEQENLTLIWGKARFIGPKVLEVAKEDGSVEEVRGDAIFLNTGARPAIPVLEGLDSVPYLVSSSIMELDLVPEHLLIVGGGYIGLEFGQMFRRFGSNVSIVHRGEQLLSREDKDVADEILKILREDGIEVYLGSVPSKVAQGADGTVTLTVERGEEQHRLTGTHLLVAAGRIPNSDELNLDAAGLETDDRGFIRVNESLETGVADVFALGDVKGGPAFTHISYDDYRIVAANFLRNENRTVSGRPVPYAVFIDPQLGRVGLSEREAQKLRLRYRVAKMPMTWIARALEMDETRGLMKVLVEEDSEQILGCAILGVEGGELMAILQTAIMGKVPYTALRDGVFAHPTLAESLNNLFFALE
jgi:pyruvate/2-oxoglutarate dehydrogenase complex dihydrolipoamide dehydrogenase (E3) component